MRVFIVVESDSSISSAHYTLDGAEKAVATMFKDIVSSQPELGKYGWDTFFEIIEVQLEE